MPVSGLDARDGAWRWLASVEVSFAQPVPSHRREVRGAVMHIVEDVAIPAV